MISPAIQVQDLTKSYGPSGLTFSVPHGSICGFLGPNGSGKTTTLRILMGLAHAVGGSAHILGTPAGASHEIFRKVAFVPELKDLYPFARVEEMISLTRGFYPDWDHALERRLIDFYYAGLARRNAVTLNADEFLRSYELCVMQHAIKMMGRFLMFERNGKTGYAGFVPYTIAQTRRILSGKLKNHFPRLAQTFGEAPR